MDVNAHQAADESDVLKRSNQGRPTTQEHCLHNVSHNWLLLQPQVSLQCLIPFRCGYAPKLQEKIINRPAVSQFKKFKHVRLQEPSVHIQLKLPGWQLRSVDNYLKFELLFFHHFNGKRKKRHSYLSRPTFQNEFLRWRQTHSGIGRSKHFKNQISEWQTDTDIIHYTNFSTKKGESPVLGGERQRDRDKSQHWRLPKGQHRRFKLVCLLYRPVILRSVSPFWF